MEEKINFQTQKKINDVKEAIKNGVNLKEIIKSKFGSLSKKENWLNKNSKFFSNEELTYLEHITPVEVVEEENHNQNKDISSSEEIINKSFEIVNFSNVEEIKTPQDKLNFLMNDDVIKVLFNLAKNNSLQKANIVELKLKLEELQKNYLEKPVFKNIRINPNLYNSFTSFCEENDLTIINCLTVAMAEFLTKYDIK